MKTAMQELIERLKRNIEEMPNEKNQFTQGYKSGLSFVIEYATNSLEKEKEQILDARLDGFVISGEGWNGEYPFEGKTYEEISLKINNEEYYKITYDQNK